jgi:hypothetical protein
MTKEQYEREISRLCGVADDLLDLVDDIRGQMKRYIRDLESLPELADLLVEETEELEESK